jgi:hypothetical protein
VFEGLKVATPFSTPCAYKAANRLLLRGLSNNGSVFQRADSVF